MDEKKLTSLSRSVQPQTISCTLAMGENKNESEIESLIVQLLLTCPIGLNKIHHWFFKRYENRQRYIIDTISNRHHQRKTRKTKSKIKKEATHTHSIQIKVVWTASIKCGM